MDRLYFTGTLTTAGGLVFLGDLTGNILAVDAARGAPLWHFSTHQGINASPMTYQLEGRQYVTLAAGSELMTFALFHPYGR